MLFIYFTPLTSCCHSCWEVGKGNFGCVCEWECVSKCIQYKCTVHVSICRRLLARMCVIVCVCDSCANMVGVRAKEQVEHEQRHAQQAQLVISV